MKSHLYSLTILFALCIMALGSIDTDPNANNVAGSPSSQSSTNVKIRSAQLISTVVRSVQDTEGRPVGEFAISWKNTGDLSIHGVKADVVFLDQDGNEIKTMNTWIYVADGWGLPGESPRPNASTGIPPGFVYIDPIGEGIRLLPMFRPDGSFVVPTGARVTGIYAVQ